MRPAALPAPLGSRDTVPLMNPIRPAIENLEPNGIALVAMTWRLASLTSSRFGSARATWSRPTFIRDAAKQALDDGKTFYSCCARHPAAARGHSRFSQAHRRRRHRSRAHHHAGRRHAGGRDGAANAWSRPATMSWSSRRSGPTFSRPRRWWAPRSASRGWMRTGTRGSLASRSRKAVRALRRAHQGNFHRLARQSHRLDDDARRTESSSRFRAQARHRHHQRRSLWHADL